MLARRVATWLPSIALLATSGCAIPVTGAEGTRHYVVVGFGIVSVPGPSDAPVTAVKVQALGVVVSAAPDARLVAGYTKSYQVEVAAYAAPVLLELSDSIAGPLKIRTQMPDSQEKDP